MLWDDMVDQSQNDMFRANCVTVSVTSKIANEVT